MRKFFRRLHFLLHRRQLEADLAEEMRAHRELVARDRHASFGRELTLREEARKVWGWIWLDRFCQDLRYAARLFRRSPGFTLGAVTVLALGVGANLAEFHVFDALLLHRLNVNGAESIFRLSRNSKDLGASSFPFQTVDFFRESCAQCSFVTAEGGWRDVALETDTNARANFVSGDYFSSLGILPAWGRLLNERDAQPGAPAVAVLGYEYWQNHFGSDPHVIDRIVRINGNPVEIVGVAPYDFDGLQPHSTAAWLAIRQRAALIPGSPPLESYNRADAYLYARPKPGVSLASLEAELTALDRQLAHREPAQFKSGERILAERLPGSGVVARKIPPAVFLLFALALLILLSACANLANMLLARGVARRREIEIRIGLGAGKARVIRQLLTENLLLSVMGCAAGLLAGYVIAHLLVAALGAPPSIRIALHPQILAGAAILTIFSAITFGLPSALQVTAAKHKSGRRRSILVGVQVAISTLLLICSGVLTRNAIRNADIQLAFDYRNMLVVYPAFYRRHLPPGVAVQKSEALQERLGQLPGAEAITSVVMPPLGQRYSLNHLPALPPLYTNYVAPNYFAAMKLAVVRGRSFLHGEVNAVIVSESAARAIWPNQDPIGKSWQFENSSRTIVGVVKDSRSNLVVDSQSVEAYLPIEPARADQSALIVHVKGDLPRLIRAIPAMSASMGEQVNVIPMLQSRENVLDGQRKTITVIASMGFIATVLAAAGMFAMVAFTVAQRTREIGIRMAIGARPRNILQALFDQTYAPVTFGMIAGTVLGLAVGKMVKSMLVITDNPLDPAGFFAGLAGFLLVAFLATLSPTLKALRIDPASTLRYE